MRILIILWVLRMLLIFSSCTGQPSFDAFLISNSTESTESLFIIDLDGDGDQDILGAAAEYDHDVIWWRNDGGYPVQWTKIIIADNFSGAGTVYAADLNNDSLVDIIAGAKLGNEVAWWKNGGGNPVVWTKYIIQGNYIFPHEVFATDLDQDGKTDVLAASSGLHEITWWKNEGGNPISWTRQTIGSNFAAAKSVHTGDFNGDSLTDVVGASLSGNLVAWWENGGGSPISWIKHDVDNLFQGAHRVQAVDMDKDGRIDILGVSYYGNKIAWWKNEGGNPVGWSNQVIATNFVKACVAMAVDLDNDNCLDVVATSQNGHEVAWWKNNGSYPIVWTKNVIDSNLYRAWPLCTGDLDGDGDNDIIAASGIEGNNEVKWYANNLLVNVNEWSGQFSSNGLVDITPNPVKDFLHITWSNPQVVINKIDLYSVTFKRLKNLFSGELLPSQKEISIGIPELSEGWYIVKISTNSGINYQKILIR